MTVFDAAVDPLAPILHTMSWATDVLVARNRIEQRRSLRRLPAQVLEFTVDAVVPYHTSRIDALLQDGAPDGFKVPFWCDRLPLPANLGIGATSVNFTTAGYDFRDDEELIFWSSPRNWEIVLISAVAAGSVSFAATTKAWPAANTLIAPIKQGYLMQPVSSSRLARDAQSSALRFAFI